MPKMKTLVVRSLAAAMCVVACGAKAEAITIQYLVDFAQSGDVMVGSTLDWTITAVVSDAGNVPMGAVNGGTRTAAVNLLNSTGEVMSAGTIQPNYAFYGFAVGGVPGAPGELNDIGASMIFFNGAVVQGENGDLGPHVLATGSYVVNTLGMHTLSTTMALSNSFYFTAADGSTFATYDTQLFGSDSVNVVAMAAVPEPASMMLASTLIVPGVIGVRRRRRQRAAKQTA
jgi:hypothetical protein